MSLITSRISAFGLLNGGTAGLIYMYILVVVLFFMVNISMAEMASMAPTAGESRRVYCRQIQFADSQSKNVQLQTLY